MSGLIGLTLIVAMIGPAAPLYSKTPREVAAERYERAQVLLVDLDAVPELELGIKQYTLVANTFRSVHRASPASGYCDDALLAAAHIHARMASRFGEDPYKNRAITAYSYLIREYPHSKLLGEARDSIRRLEAGERIAVPPVKAPTPARLEPVVSKTPAPAKVTNVRYARTRGSSDTVAVGGKIQLAPKRTRESQARVQDLRYWGHPEYLRVVVQLDDFVPFQYDALANPPRLYFDLFSAKLSGKLEKGISLDVTDDPVVSSIRLGQNRQSKSRLVLDLTAEAIFDVSWLSNPPRMVLEIRPKNAVPAPTPDSVTRLAKAAPALDAATVEQAFDEVLSPRSELRRQEQPVSGGFLPTARAASLPPNIPTLSKAQPSGLAAASTTQAPTTAKVSPPTEATPRPRDTSGIQLASPKAADAPSRGSQGLIRALGLKIGRVVIDAGHGGHDTGMIGPTGLREKDVVLDIALKLGRLVEEKLGAEVIYTRSDDTFRKPSARTKVANAADADLFVSVHANASSVRSVRGIETYYLSLTTDAWAMKVASRENAASDRSVHELRDILDKIAQQDRVAESREFATRIQASVFSGLTKDTQGLRNRGVRKAPLIVLIGAQMPAILAEVGFLSNPTDEKLFKSKAYRHQVAAHLFDGIEAYMATLSNNRLTMTDGPRAAAATHD
jgi:N-acetylmuramoyl-L-alanine amidase